MDGNSEISLMANAARNHFAKRFGSEPTWASTAPGRVNLIGEHVDYNQGLVLPFAIDRHALVIGSIADNVSLTSTIHSVQQNESFDIDLNQPVERNSQNHWSNYILGVLAGFQDLGFEFPPLNILVHSNVPIGAGLSSSAAIEVATATLLESIVGTTIDLHQKVMLCQKAEHEFAGVPCGIMDQFVSVFAEKDSLLLLDCQSLNHESIPIRNGEWAFLVINSHVKHSLAESEYPLRRQQCKSAASVLKTGTLRDTTTEHLNASRSELSNVEFRRVRHVITENQRTLETVKAIRNNDWPEVGKLLCKSHESLRDNYNVSCNELDLLVDLANELGPLNGVLGARMIGGGFGGCTLSLVEQDKSLEISKSITKRFKRLTGMQANSLVTKPVKGAQMLSS